MARVFIPASLRRFTGETAELRIPARDLRELISVLDARFPGIGEAIRSGLAVAAPAPAPALPVWLLEVLLLVLAVLPVPCMPLPLPLSSARAPSPSK